MEQRNDQFNQSEPTPSGVGSERTPIEQMAETARATATEAADSFRRGEFLHNAITDAEANADDRLIALLSYVTQIVIPLVMPVIVLLSESSKLRPFQRYHAVQSLALTCLFIAVSVAVGIVCPRPRRRGHRRDLRVPGRKPVLAAASEVGDLVVQ